MAAPRRRLLYRRRRVFAALVASAGGTLLLGVIPGLRDLLKVHLLIDLVLAAYISYLIQIRGRLQTEEPVLADEPVYLRAEHF